MKKQIIIGLLAALVGFSANAQSAGDQDPSVELRVGFGRTFFKITQDQAHEFSGALYIARKGHQGFAPMIVVPVSVSFSKELTMISAGAGVSTTGTADQLLTHQISLAAANIINKDPNIIDPANANRFGLLLQNEIGFNLSKRLNMALTVNLDLLNGLRSSKDAQETMNHFDQVTEADKYKLRDETIKYEYKAASMTSFSLKLSYSLFRK
jgi:hypothetical protein